MPLLIQTSAFKLGRLQSSSVTYTPSNYALSKSIITSAILLVEMADKKEDQLNDIHHRPLRVLF